MLPETGASTIVTAWASADRVSWSASAAPTLLICSQIVPSRPIVEQRRDQIEDDVGGREHGDHRSGVAHYLARLVSRLATTVLEIAQVLSVAVPRDHRDALVEKSTAIAEPIRPTPSSPTRTFS